MAAKLYSFSVVWASRGEIEILGDRALSKGEHRITATSPYMAEKLFNQNFPGCVAWAVWHGPDWANRLQNYRVSLEKV